MLFRTMASFTIDCYKQHLTWIPRWSTTSMTSRITLGSVSVLALGLRQFFLTRVRILQRPMAVQGHRLTI